MSEFKASGFRDEFGNAGPDLVGITTLTSPYYFVPPSGSTAERPSDPPPGMLRFNTDIGRLEVWRNDHWATILGESPNLGDNNVSNSAAGTGTRAIAYGGNNGSPYDDIEYFTIETLGNAQDFGNTASGTRTTGQCCASRTGAIYGGGQVPGAPSTAEMEFVTIASTGTATDWGADLSDGRDFLTSFSNQTRGLWAGGRTSGSNTASRVVDYVTIASSGQTAQDFGDLRHDALWYPMSFASSVRGVVGQSNSSPSPTSIDYFTISSTGSGQDFGTLSSNFGGVGGSNATRGLFAGGYTPTLCNVISFVTIASTGNTQDFGDLTQTTRGFACATNSTRAVFIGGKTPSNSNVLSYVTITTTGNAEEFGSLTGSNSGQKGNIGGCSNGHGGL